MVEWYLNWPLTPILWVSWSQFSAYGSLSMVNQGVSDKGI